jgi:hypothetical protein
LPAQEQEPVLLRRLAPRQAPVMLPAEEPVQQLPVRAQVLALVQGLSRLARAAWRIW